MSLFTTPAEPYLDRLPVEVTEAFASQLDFSDICNLRLVSRELAAKAWQGCFKAFFRYKLIDLRDSIQVAEFGRVTGPNGLGCLVESLRLVRMVRIEDLSAEQKREIRSALIDRFKCLKTNSASGCLQELSLDVLAEGEPLEPASPPQEYMG